MIALDTSSLRAFVEGEAGKDVAVVQQALVDGVAVIPPVVLTELLSGPNLPEALVKALSAIPLLDITTGYWERAGRMRAKAIAKGHKARVADALIAQSCIDHHVRLVTRDRDFRHFVRLGLKLLP